MQGNKCFDDDSYSDICGDSVRASSGSHVHPTQPNAPACSSGAPGETSVALGDIVQPSQPNLHAFSTGVPEEASAPGDIVHPSKANSPDYSACVLEEASPNAIASRTYANQVYDIIWLNANFPLHVV